MHKITGIVEYQNSVTRMNFLDEQDDIRPLSHKEAAELDDLTFAVAEFEENN